MKTSFVFNEDIGEQIDCFPDDRQLFFYKAMRQYSISKQEPEDFENSGEKAVWVGIKKYMDSNSEKFEKKCMNLKRGTSFPDSEKKTPTREKNTDSEKKTPTREKKDVSGGEYELEYEYEYENIPPISPEGETESGYSRAFESFWAVYPKKVGKGAAAKSFAKSFAGIKSGQDSNRLRAKMIEQVLVQMDTDQWKRNGGQFIPNPATWLNQRRWEDGTGQSTESELRAAGWTDADIAAGFKCS